MLLGRRRKLSELPINSLIPNMLTTLALCAGLTSVRFALEDKWQLAVAAILVAGVLDGLDGRMARLLKGSSKFGAELDSLSDFVSFGVAPALVLYLWTLDQGLGNFGWIIALVFTVSCGLRLARFNAMLDEDQPAWEARYFTGIAAPAGASISLLFIVVSFYSDAEIFQSAILNAGWLLLMAFLMASRIPTFSIKRIRVARRFIMPMLIVVGGLAAVMASYPWELLTGVALVYLATIPFAIATHRRLVREEVRKKGSVDLETEKEKLSK
ncbi:CDP-alcohol phosphatidyltransferase family protein [Sneathiella chinensis]|uniref:CDP-diacylglycerol--serine O-phosphatidyltransferase n=1 Tax=Sneathiella chinensis TaxID=349750 RepID=A0ABQ5U735_9PROT|nr:phosphatidylcholine/phosphatidylserine synthase [Sneathiella chinensis]GLQ07074.1 CDP-diacylglycerol--serine O-phosphatidyltransferase [Sneathiella chinensis]